MSDQRESAVKWACPGCGAEANAHGKGGSDACKDRDAEADACCGFLCECENETTEHHGETHADPCNTARCYHCNWSGTFPRPPVKAQAWEKKALAAGWSPPKGWAAKVVETGAKKPSRGSR